MTEAEKQSLSEMPIETLTEAEVDDLWIRWVNQEMWALDREEEEKRVLQPGQKSMGNSFAKLREASPPLFGKFCQLRHWSVLPFIYQDRGMHRLTPEKRFQGAQKASEAETNRG